MEVTSSREIVIKLESETALAFSNRTVGVFVGRCSKLQARPIQIRRFGRDSVIGFCGSQARATQGSRDITVPWSRHRHLHCQVFMKLLKARGSRCGEKRWIEKAEEEPARQKVYIAIPSSFGMMTLLDTYWQSVSFARARLAASHQFIPLTTPLKALSIHSNEYVNTMKVLLHQATTLQLV